MGRRRESGTDSVVATLDMARGALSASRTVAAGSGRVWEVMPGRLASPDSDGPPEIIGYPETHGLIACFWEI